jgi:hypothetical protein
VGMLTILRVGTTGGEAVSETFPSIIVAIVLFCFFCHAHFKNTYHCRLSVPFRSFEVLYSISEN